MQATKTPRAAACSLRAAKDEVQDALILAFANATKPLRHCNGLVALANANS